MPARDFRGAARGAVLVLVAVAAIAASTAQPSAAASPGAGSFSTSDAQLDAVWAASVKTAEDMRVPGPLTADWLGRPCRIALPEVLIDGVVRDRCPYVGDEAVIDATLDASDPDWPLQRSMLVWFADAQRPNGSIPASPLDGGDLDLIDYNAYWVQVLYTYVLYSGDVGTARTVWPHLVRLLDRFYPPRVRGGLLVNTLGDADYAYIHRDGSVVAYYNAGYVLALEDAAKLAGWLGRTADERRWQARAEATRKVFAGAFWDARVGAFADTTLDRETHPQDANAFAVLAGVATKSQGLSAMSYLSAHEARTYGNAIADTDNWDGPAWGHQADERVYPFMSYFEVEARFELGLDDSAFDLIRREWGYMLRVGPGTMWETIGPFGGPPSDQHPSYDSGWSSGAAPALSRYVLGVVPTSPGFATFIVKPHSFDLSFASGTVPTPHGPISVSWRRAGTGFRLTVHAPPGARWTTARS